MIPGSVYVFTALARVLFQTAHFREKMQWPVLMWGVAYFGQHRPRRWNSEGSTAFADGREVFERRL